MPAMAEAPSGAERHAALARLAGRREAEPLQSFVHTLVLDANPDLETHRRLFGTRYACRLQFDAEFNGFMPTRRATIEQVADGLGMNIRALQRRLDHDRETFSVILNGVRRDLAIRYLGTGDYSLARVAELLGYAAPGPRNQTLDHTGHRDHDRRCRRGPRGGPRNLPQFAYAVVFHRRVWQWLAAGVVVGLTIVVILFAYRLARWIDRAPSVGRKLNAVVCGPPLYDDGRFAHVDLSPETARLLDSAADDDDLRRLNRLLLQDAFPSELSHRNVRREVTA